MEKFPKDEPNLGKKPPQYLTETLNNVKMIAEVLNDIYYKLNEQYFGEDIVIDPEIALEWARIPHFYTPFYVYQYATGFSAAVAISRKILAGEPGIVEKYKEFGVL